MNIYLIFSLQTFRRNAALQFRQRYTDDPVWGTMNAHDAHTQLVTLTGSNVTVFSFIFGLSEFGFVYVTEVFFPLLQCKRRFERECKEADRAQQYFERMDADINVTKADVEKVNFRSSPPHQ